MSGAALMARSRDLDEGEEEIWGTCEELLLACAVARHGTRRWDSIASEVQSRIAQSSAPLITPSRCRQRFDLLQLRFSAAVATDSAGAGGGSPGEVPLIEELRKLRVAELRREVERSDHSIVSLKLKLKNLKEEGERRVSGGSDPETDQNPKPESPGSTEEELARDRVSTESSKESNSTDLKGNAGKLDEEAGECTAGVGKRETEPATEERDHGLAESRESGESAAELKSSDAEETSEGRTSASHARQPRRRRRKAPLANSSGGGEPEADAVSLRGGTTSQPFVKILEVIRGSASGSVFERRLESQNSAEYRGLIRCHVDLEMISEKIERLGAAYTRTEFFRDLLLLCNNAIVFYLFNSKESISAVHLRDQISKEMAATHQPPPQPPLPVVKIKVDPHLGSLLEKSESAIPLIACRKRSSITSKKTNPDPKVKRKADPDPDPDPDSDPDPKPKPKPKQKKKTKERPELPPPPPPPPPSPPPPPASSRGFRTSKSRFLNQSRRSHPSTNPKAEEVEIEAKPEKKNSGGAAAAALAKKRGAATLLKRIKRTPEENENISPPSSTISGDKAAGKKKAGKGDGRRASEPKGSNQKTAKKVVKVSAPAKRVREEVEAAKPSPAAKKRRRR
ncbi:putative transcription factor MYB-related family [Dioscorea sansibarensis]